MLIDKSMSRQGNTSFLKSQDHFPKKFIVMYPIASHTKNKMIVLYECFFSNKIDSRIKQEKEEVRGKNNQSSSKSSF